jgi:hypothetical protein
MKTTARGMWQALQNRRVITFAAISWFFWKFIDFPKGPATTTP